MRKRGIWTALLPGLGMLMLIIDSKTAISGAADGIDLCLRVAVPSLLPFFVFSMLLTSALNGAAVPGLALLGKLCGIPAGTESLLLVGFLGGYPVGAQNVAAAYESGQLSKDTARRMLAFCSNAGPSFLFGIVAGKFTRWWIPWALWGIHILSALTVAAVLPGKDRSSAKLPVRQPLSMQTALHRSIRVMAQVCGWIVLFRVMTAFLQRWFLWLLPEEGQVIVSGILELTNGCCSLDAIENTGLRFIIVSGLLSLGGLCVAMQTASVTGNLGIGSYIRGKLLQTAISVILAFLIQLFLPAGERMGLSAPLAAAFPVLLAILAICLRESEKKSSIPARLGV